MAKHPQCFVAIEARGGAHHWARELEGVGHEVRLIAPRYVKPFIKRQKNNAADVEAIVEAALRQTMRYVEPKAGDQQARSILFHTCKQLGLGTLAAARLACSRHSSTVPEYRC